jgi:hypothetical protein
VLDPRWRRLAPASYVPPARTLYPVPGYLPDRVRPLLKWARKHVSKVAAREGIPAADLWDETITALLRASLHADPGPLYHYAQTAVHRACWRYVVRGQRTRIKTEPLARDRDEADDPTVPSAEAVCLAWEAARARPDSDTLRAPDSRATSRNSRTTAPPAPPGPGPARPDRRAG